jgi:hypothetical protein
VDKPDDDDDDVPVVIRGGLIPIEDGQTPEEALEEHFGDIDVRDISEAPPEVQAKVRQLLQSGALEIPDEVVRQMEEKGLTRDDIISGMLAALKGIH